MATDNTLIHSNTIPSKATIHSSSMVTTGLRQAMEIIIQEPQEHPMQTTILTNITTTNITITKVLRQLVHIHNNINSKIQFKFKQHHSN